MRSDFELVSACKTGDKQAYEELFTRYVPFLSKKYYSACKSYSSFSNIYEFSDSEKEQEKDSNFQKDNLLLCVCQGENESFRLIFCVCIEFC